MQGMSNAMMWGVFLPPGVEQFGEHGRQSGIDDGGMICVGIRHIQFAAFGLRHL